jgi:predicted nuclease of predicted toxin-antitoxin system
MSSFLIDECLTPRLVVAAQARGNTATHIAHLQRSGTDDWVIAQIALQRDAIFVTNNARDFLRIYARLDIHPGLVVILPNNATCPLRLAFGKAMDFIESRGDIVSHLIEVSADGAVALKDWSAFDPPTGNM